MRNCIRIPRILLPRVIESWAAPACDAHPYNRNFWESTKGTAPSALLCVQPEIYGDELDDDRKEELHGAMYAALEEEWLKKLDFGMLLVERTGTYGSRKGILACIDLEAYGTDSEALVRPAFSRGGGMEPWLSARRGSVLEFPHSVALYNDKKGKLVRALEKEELEEVYSSRLPFCGDKIHASFLPADLSAELSRELMQCADPSFLVVDGVRALSAAKAYWEEIKKQLSEAERRMHPARFTLLEFINVFDEGLRFYPVHRVIKETDIEAFCDYFSRSVPCKQQGNVFAVADWKGAQQADAVIAEYLRKSGGRVQYIQDTNEFEERVKEGAGVLFPAVEREDIFPTLKKGCFPYKAFSLAQAEKRYSLEGREISYD